MQANKFPILPRSEKNPAGGSRQVAEFMTIFEGVLALTRRELFAYLDSLPEPREEETPEASTELVVNARKYVYQVDPETLTATVRDLLDRLWKKAKDSFGEQASKAYEVGSSTANRSMRTILGSTEDLTQPLTETPFIQRVALVRARVFEEMEGFRGSEATRLGTLLLEGITEGKGIQALKSSLKEAFKISASRAETIARTEIIGALRRGRTDQAEVTAQEFGVEVGMMWFSALSPTTRRSHASMHGKVLTPQEVREFYAKDGNAINCKCGQVEVLMKDGKPLQEKLVGRETLRRDRYLGKDK